MQRSGTMINAPKIVGNAAGGSHGYGSALTRRPVDFQVEDIFMQMTKRVGITRPTKIGNMPTAEFMRRAKIDPNVFEIELMPNTPQTPYDTLLRRGTGVESLAFSPTLLPLYKETDQNKLLSYNIATGKIILRIPEDATTSLTTAAYGLRNQLNMMKRITSDPKVVDGLRQVRMMRNDLVKSGRLDKDTVITLVPLPQSQSMQSITQPTTKEIYAPTSTPDIFAHELGHLAKPTIDPDAKTPPKLIEQAKENSRKKYGNNYPDGKLVSEFQKLYNAAVARPNETLADLTVVDLNQDKLMKDRLLKVHNNMSLAQKLAIAGSAAMGTNPHPTIPTRIKNMASYRDMLEQFKMKQGLPAQPPTALRHIRGGSIPH